MIRCDDKVNLDSTIVRFAIADAVLRDSLAQPLTDSCTSIQQNQREVDVHMSPAFIAELRIEDK